jgi:hypothetical protein
MVAEIGVSIMNLKKLAQLKLSMNSFYGPVNLNRILPKWILTLTQSDSRDKIVMELSHGISVMLFEFSN